jgi:hypothetical protein
MVVDAGVHTRLCNWDKACNLWFTRPPARNIHNHRQTAADHWSSRFYRDDAQDEKAQDNG